MVAFKIIISPVSVFLMCIVGEKVVVVFVPSDESAKDAQAYFAEDHGDWYMVPYDDSSRWDLKKRYAPSATIERLRYIQPASSVALVTGARGNALGTGAGQVEQSARSLATEANPATLRNASAFPRCCSSMQTLRTAQNWTSRCGRKWQKP